MPVIAPAAAQFLGGAAQLIFSGKKKKERDLENYANSYQPNSSILDAYNKAYQRYSTNPYTSQFYQTAQNKIGRNLATGISASQDRRGGLATIGSLVQGANDATANAGVTAENMQGEQLSQLQQAANMKAQEEEKKYDMIYNLKAMKAGAANQQQSAGLENMFGGLGSGANYLSASENGFSGYGKPYVNRRNRYGINAGGTNGLNDNYV